MTTYRERRQRRAERLAEWADGNAAKAAAKLSTASTMAEAIPFGQPILTDHYSARSDRRYRDRIHNNMRAGVELDAKAREQARKAASITAADERAIYDDDPDAIERLTEKLAGLEAERARWKAYNAAARKGSPAALDELDARQRAEVASLVKISRITEGGPVPSYLLTNLGGNITRTRQRLARLTAAAEREAAGILPPARVMAARFGSPCDVCGADIEKGETIHYRKRHPSRAVTCDTCEKGER